MAEFDYLQALRLAMGGQQQLQDQEIDARNALSAAVSQPIRPGYRALNDQGEVRGWADTFKNPTEGQKGFALQAGLSLLGSADSTASLSSRIGAAIGTGSQAQQKIRATEQAQRASAAQSNLDIIGSQKENLNAQMGFMKDISAEQRAVDSAARSERTESRLERAQAYAQTSDAKRLQIQMDKALKDKDYTLYATLQDQYANLSNQGAPLIVQRQRAARQLTSKIENLKINNAPAEVINQAEIELIEIKNLINKSGTVSSGNEVTLYDDQGNIIANVGGSSQQGASSNASAAPLQTAVLNDPSVNQAQQPSSSYVINPITPGLPAGTTIQALKERNKPVYTEDQQNTLNEQTTDIQAFSNLGEIAFDENFSSITGPIAYPTLEATGSLGEAFLSDEARLLREKLKKNNAKLALSKTGYFKPLSEMEWPRLLDLVKIPTNIQDPQLIQEYIISTSIPGAFEMMQDAVSRSRNVGEPVSKGVRHRLNSATQLGIEYLTSPKINIDMMPAYERNQDGSYVTDKSGLLIRPSKDPKNTAYDILNNWFPKVGADTQDLKGMGLILNPKTGILYTKEFLTEYAYNFSTKRDKPIDGFGLPQMMKLQGLVEY